MRSAQKNQIAKLLFNRYTAPLIMLPKQNYFINDAVKKSEPDPQGLGSDFCCFMAYCQSYTKHIASMYPGICPLGHIMTFIVGCSPSFAENIKITAPSNVHFGIPQ